MMGVLDMGEELGSLADEVESSSEKVSRGSHLGRVGVGERHSSSSQEHGDLQGIELIVLGLGAMDKPHVERVAEDEIDLFSQTEIGQPVPGKDTLSRDDEVVSKRLDGL